MRKTNRRCENVHKTKRKYCVVQASVTALKESSELQTYVVICDSF